MTTVIHQDEAIVFVPVKKSLNTAPAGSGSLESGFSHARKTKYAYFPQQDLSPVWDPACKCLRNVFMEADIKVGMDQSTCACTHAAWRIIIERA